MVHDVSRSSCRLLDAARLAFMKPRFGQDFSHVRVHADAKAGFPRRASFAAQTAPPAASDAVSNTLLFDHHKDYMICPPRPF